MIDLYSVAVFDNEGWWRYAGRHLDAETAVELSRDMVELSATPAGRDIHRVIITDAGDNTNFLWERGKGIVFPPRMRFRKEDH